MELSRTSGLLTSCPAGGFLMANTSKQSFAGFRSPNYTQVPDELFDELMADLSGTELKVLLYIMRRTFGFKKDQDNISLNQICHGITRKTGKVIDRGTGLSKASAARALKSLEEQGIILRSRRRSAERGDEATTYRLNVRGRVPVSQNQTRPRVSKMNTQKTELTQETDVNHSKLRKALPKNDEKNEESSAKQGNNRLTVPPIAGGEDLQPAAATRGLAAIGDVLASRRQQSQCYDEDRQVIIDLLSDFRREFNDQATLKQSVSRAYNLMQRSHLDMSTFISRMYEARAITKERSASITSVLAGSTSFSAKHKMAYWFSVLEDLCGLKPNDPAQSSPSGEQS
jgi:phage replication O-like protein O